MSNHIKIHEIFKNLPHRYPFLLVDKITEINLKKNATGIKNVTFNEPHFQGHFPDKPIMPGVLIIEAMAQVASVLVIKSEAVDLGEKLIYFTSIDSAKFRKPVIPGDVLEMKVEIVGGRKSLWKMHGKAFVDGELAAEANFAAMIIDKKKQKF